MIKQVSRVVYFAVCFALLSGCGNQNFDCPTKDGVRCMRLSEVDKQISAGKLGVDSQPQKSTKAATMLAPLQPMQAFFVPEEGSPLRRKEEVLSIWMAPYQSEDGTYHEQNVLHFVAVEASWTVPHAVIENLEEQDHAKP